MLALKGPLAADLPEGDSGEGVRFLFFRRCFAPFPDPLPETLPGFDRPDAGDTYGGVRGGGEGVASSAIAREARRSRILARPRGMMVRNATR